TLSREALITGLNFSASRSPVVRRRYCVAASSSPLKMLQASCIVIDLIASIKIGLASRAASSAPRFRVRINLSTSPPSPICRSRSSTFLTSGGNGILISGFPKEPSVCDTRSAPHDTPLISASLRPSATSEDVGELPRVLFTSPIAWLICAVVQEPSTTASNRNVLFITDFTIVFKRYESYPCQ